MKRSLLFISILLPVCFFTAKAWAQNNVQTVTNGSSTTAISFQSPGCIYNWVNNTPGIGLAANGSGDIPPFTAVNNTNTPIIATITATPVQSPGYAYIANSDDGTVSVINLLTQKVIATPKVGNTPIYITVSPDGTTVYISNYYGRSVSVIDVATNLVTGIIPTAIEPAGLAVSPDGTKLYVCDSTIVSVFSTTSLHENLANITIGEYPNSIAFSPDGSTAYVTKNYSIKNNVFIINTATSKVTGSLTAGTAPAGVLVNPNGKYLYVANTYDNDISVFNTATGKLVTNIPVGTGPLGIAFSPDGQKLYVSNSGDNSTSKLAPGSVSVINLANNKVITTILLGGSTYPLGISITPDGKQVYVVNDNTDNVTIINTATYAISTNSINVGQYPNSIGNFMAAGPLCSGSPVTYTITVNPTSKVTIGKVTGNIFSCSGSASVSPNIQQFTLSGNFFSGNVIATAPAGFELSLTANNGYGNSVTLTPDKTALNNASIYVRSAADAPTGDISGNVVIQYQEIVLSSANPFDYLDVAVAGTINAAAAPSVFISASGNDICTGTPVTFTATPSNGGTSPVYQWQVNDHNAGTNSATFTSSTLNNGDVVSCIITSNAPCITPASITSNEITMNVATQVNVPSVSITTSGNNTCAGSPVTFTAMPVNGGNAAAYQWQVNGNNDGTNNSSFTSSTLQNGDVVNCIMTSSIGCSVPATVTSNDIIMDINALPLVNTGGDKTITVGKSVILNAAATGNIADITWSPATGLSNNKILNPVASPSSTTTYTLTVQNTDDCVGTGIVTLHVTYPIIIPNIFTPNGDGRNDTWDIKYLDTYTNCKVQVFNRWGQLLYSSTGYGIPWDGTYKGSAVPNGTYYYVINLEQNTKPLAGYVMVVR